MSQYLHELCCLLVEDFYGVFHASIYSHLTPSGRFTASQIAHKLQLPVRQVKSGLATLVQLRLIYHHTSKGPTTYQANTRSTYDLIRCGKLVELARARHGELGGEIITTSFLLGCCTIAELTQRVAKYLENSEQNLANGHSINLPGHDFSLATIHDTIQSMARDRFLIHIRSAQFQSDFDASTDAGIHLGSLGIFPPTKGRKGLVEYEIKVEEELRSRQSINNVEHGTTPNGLVTHDDNDGIDTRPAKRQRYLDSSSGNPVNGHHNDRDVPQSVLLGINCYHVVKSIRDNHVASISKKSFGPRDNLVIETALAQIPVTQLWDWTETKFELDVHTLQEQLNKILNNDESGDRPRTNGHIESEIAAADNRYSLRDIDQHLATIAESMFDFVEKGYDSREWRLDKQALDSFLRQDEMLRLIADRLDPPALRIIRMLIQKGKLDEKMLQEAGLLGAKQLRQTLAELKQMGFVDLQEVPREAQRQPNRTIFLWFHDSQRARQLLLESLFKSMARLYQRLKLERKKLASTLEKVERSDVRGSEEQILSTPELKVLRRLQRTEEWLMGELGRLDASVAILRDL